MDGSLLLQQLTGVNDRVTFNCAEPVCDDGRDVYVTKDMLTDPPTVIHIVRSTSLSFAQAIASGQAGSVQFINFSDIEPTAGWLGDRNRSSLDICFMHSFGKCTGKTREKHPATCHQIHVKREVLDTVRQRYTFPQRQYFCRTMKANITEQVSRQLWNLARKRFSLQYLEFKTEDIDVTAASTAYEVEYRRWLTSNVVSPPVKDEKSPPTENYISTTNLCWEYAITGRCPKGVSCQDIHGLLVNSLSKHRYIKMALKEIHETEEIRNSPETSSNGMLSRQGTASIMYPIQPQFYPAPQYYTLPNTLVSHRYGCGHTSLATPPVPHVSLPTSQPLPPWNPVVYVLMEGSDNILRIVPLRS